MQHFDEMIVQLLETCYSTSTSYFRSRERPGDSTLLENVYLLRARAQSAELIAFKSDDTAP